MYKSLALAALLVPFSGYSAEKDVRINELKEAQYQKALELKELAKELRTAGYESYISDEFDYVHRKIVSILSKMTVNKRKTEEEIINSLEEENGGLYDRLTASLIHGSDFNINITQSLVLESGDFDALKTIYIESAVQEFYLRLLAEKFKKCLGEMLHINQEIKKLG